MALVLVLVCVLGLVGCGKNATYKVRITVPAGSTEEFVYSEEEIRATGKKITISTGDGLGEEEILHLGCLCQGPINVLMAQS